MIETAQFIATALSSSAKRERALAVPDDKSPRDAAARDGDGDSDPGGAASARRLRSLPPGSLAGTPRRAFESLGGDPKPAAGGGSKADREEARESDGEDDDAGADTPRRRALQAAAAAALTKTIILTGAMRPQKFEDSDAEFNVRVPRTAFWTRQGSVPWMRASLLAPLATPSPGCPAMSRHSARCTLP